MKKSISLFTIILLFATVVLAEVYSPSMMPNVNVKNRYEFVSDPANLLSEEVKSQVNKTLWDLREKTSVEAVVALPPDIGDMPIEDWSEKLFTSWGIGKSDKDNGVLLVISPDSHQARIQTGYGVEGVLTDIACNNIIRRAIIPAMKENNINGAVSGAVMLMSQALTDPAVADELRSAEADNYSGNLEMLSPEVIWNFIKYIALGLFIFSFGFYIYGMIHTKKMSRYDKANYWRKNLLLYIICSVLSLGSAIIFLVLCYSMYRMARNRPIKCSTCGTKMHRLPEDEDNELLSDSQDFEEKLKTVDYDVWECPRCGTVERFPYKAKQLKYSECPRCHTIAMCLDHDSVIVPATERHPGRGEKVYVCKFCNHQKRTPYRIAQKESAAPLVAGAVLGSMGRGGGFGDGGFGGGFGGGATGGGGASGSW